MLWQSLPGWICTFCKYHLILQTLFTCCFLLFNYYTLNTWSVPLHLPRSRVRKNLKWAQRSLMEVTHLFCLSVTLDDPPPLACADTEKKEGPGGEGKAVIYLHLPEPLEHENNIKNGSITYRLPEAIERGWEFSLYHPSYSLGKAHAISTPRVPLHEVSLPLLPSLYTLISTHTHFALWTEAMTHSLWLN